MLKDVNFVSSEESQPRVLYLGGSTVGWNSEALDYSYIHII